MGVPSSLFEFVGDPSASGDKACTTNFAPQSPQNRLPDGFSAPHFEQTLASGAPQSPQKRLFSGFSALQLEQRNRLPLPKQPSPCSTNRTLASCAIEEGGAAREIPFEYRRKAAGVMWDSQLLGV